MIYLLQSTSRMPPHEQLYISDVADDGFYYQTSHRCNAKTWNAHDVAVKYVDEYSRGSRTGDAAYTKHEVLELSDKDWFECKLKGRIEKDDDCEIEDCGCELCAEYIVENGTLSDQYERHLQWKKDNPEQSEALSEHVKELVEGIMNKEIV